MKGLHEGKIPNRLRLFTENCIWLSVKKISLTLIQGCSKISVTVGLFSGLGDNICRTKSLAFDDTDFHSGVSS